MPLLKELVNRLRAFLLVALLISVVLIDSVSRIISMCADGFLAVLILLLVWPLIKKP